VSRWVAVVVLVAATLTVFSPSKRRGGDTMPHGVTNSRPRGFFRWLRIFLGWF
jgi:hypothetical protein